MAKGVDQINDILNIEVDTQRLEQAVSVIKQGSKTAVDNIDKLSKGYLDVLGKLKSTAVDVNQQVTDATGQIKSLGLQLKQISTLVAGSDALRNQAAIKGFTAGFYQDPEYVKAKAALAEAQKQSAMEKATRLWRDQNIINNSNGRITQSNINDLRQMESLDRRLGAIQIKLMANYKAINMVTGAFKYLLNYTVEYDRELHQLQAIAAVSDTTMLKLKDSIQAVASSTKFTSLEVAQAGTVLAQAGLSARQIETTLPAIAKLATATGTDLATSTDVVTSTLNIYSLQASEAEHVTNALTTAMNESKADIAGFQKAIQYAGNYAAQLGVTYEETAAVISAATQAGIRSRSMLGTGLRAVLAEFLNPTKKLTAQLEKVGLTVSDIDVRSKGLSTVLKTLKESGFGATEAFRGMERRGAAFLASIINQTEFIDSLREHMAASTAAAEANEIQMNSLSAQLANFKSIAGTAASEGVAPLNKAMTALLKVVNSILSGGATSGGKPNALAGGIMSFLFGAGGVASTATSIAMIGGAIATMANQIKALEAASKATNTMKLLSFLASWKGIGIVSAIGGLASVLMYAADKFGVFTSGADKARAAIEEAQGEYEAAKEKGDALATMYERLYNQREKLQDQTERDIFLREILTRFPEAAKYVDDLRISFEGLAKVLAGLNADQAAEEAKKAAELARVTSEENFKEIKKLGEQYFGDVVHIAKRNGLGMFFEGQSNVYNNLINKMKRIGGFADLNFSRLDQNKSFNLSTLPGIHFTDISRNEYISRRSSLELYNQLRSQIDWGSNDSQKMREQYGKLLSSGLIVQGKEGEALLAIIRKIGEEVTNVANAIDKGEIKAIREMELAFSDQNTKEIDALVKLKDEAVQIGNKIDEETKYGRDTKQSLEMTKDLLAKYAEQEARLMSMEDIIRNPDGSRKDFRDYSYKELSKYTGKSEETIQQMATSLRNSGITSEERIKEIIASSSERNRKLDSIRAYMEVLELTIQKSAFGKVEFNERFMLAKNRADAIKALDAVSSAKDKKTAESKAEEYTRRMTSVNIESLVKNLPGLDSKQREALREKIRESGALKITGDYTGKNFDVSKSTDSQALLNLSKAYSEVTGNTSSSIKATEMFSEALAGQAIVASNANSELLKFNANSSKAIDTVVTAQTGMDSFFHKLNVDIKAIDTAYTNATRSMDQMLARQQGVITGLERAYGSGSAAVKAEQVRLRKLEESQLGNRNAALETKLNGYTEQLSILRGNPEYQKAKASYDNALANWKNAVDTGKDQRTINQLYRNLQDVSKGWDKLATKEESLTSKIAELNDEIQKNTTAITKETEFRKYDREHSLGSFYNGIGDTATAYVDQVEQEGLTSFRGMGGYLSEGSINGINNAFVELFDNITKGSMSASESFKQFGKSIIQTIADVAKEMMAKQVVAAIFSAFLPDVSSKGGISKSSGWSSQASGGLVTGPIKNRDSVPTMLMPGEYVLKKSAVDSLGRDYLDSLNNKSASYMSDYSSEVTEAKSETTETNTKQGNGVVNVYVVGQEQQKQMTPQDVVVTITQDMLTGGQTKKLVKSIAMGVV